MTLVVKNPPANAGDTDVGSIYASILKGFPDGSLVKNPPENADSGLIPRLGEPLVKEMATHYSSLAWKIPWREAPCGLHVVHGITGVGLDLVTKQQRKSKDLMKTIK